MRHLKSLIFASVGIAFSLQAHATPVYLKLGSRFPSGHHPRNFLEEKTREVQVQRWLRVQTSDKRYGWLAEDHVLTALKLVDQVSLLRDTPLRNVPQMDAIFGRPVVKQGTKALVLQVQGSWMRVQPLPVSENREGWFPTEVLKPELEVGPSRVFIHTETQLLAAPSANARSLGRLNEESVAHLLRELPETRPAGRDADWLEVRTGKGFGFISRSHAWTARDLGTKGARPSASLVPLRSAPLPFADQIRTLPLSAKLTVVGEKRLRWGKVSLKDTGEMWWPISDEANDSETNGPGRLPKLSSQFKITLGTDAVFNRKIFDMATSRAIPSLQLVSADGIFRTMDGEQWAQIPLFKDENHPVAIAKGGAVFVGSYVSDDHGETFRQWIRWDTLVSALEIQGDTSARDLRILEIRPEDGKGRRVTLRLHVGKPKDIRVMTEDQGMTWRLL